MIYRINPCEAGKVKSTKINWLMPRVHASDAEKFNLYGKIEKNMEVDVGFRMRQCNVM